MNGFITGISFGLALLLSCNGWSSVDPLNTYQWNRENALNKNGVIPSEPWFEWWYYKIVIPETNESFYFVYGVVNPWDSGQTMKGSRSYVGMGDFQSRTVLDDNYPTSAFVASYSDTNLSVAGNLATAHQFSGEIKNETNERFHWDVSIEKKWSFNATGWATGQNITNIEWYPAQADASCSGTIYSKGQLRQFKNAPCYQDRNWGSSFPKWWTWIVANDFQDHPETALAIGGGKPTYYGWNLPYEGVAIGLKHNGKEYSFRPNDLDKVSININFGQWEVRGINGDVKIEVSAYAPKEKFMDLQFMTPQGEVFHDYETLTGKVTVKLYKKNRGSHRYGRWTLTDTVISYRAGIEYGSYDTYSIHSLFNSKQNLQ